MNYHRPAEGRGLRRGAEGQVQGDIVPDLNAEWSKIIICTDADEDGFQSHFGADVPLSAAHPDQRGQSVYR